MTDPGRPVVVGCGGLGIAVAQELVRLGMQPRVLSRTGRRRVPDGVEMVVADVSEQRIAVRAFDGAGLVINCAAPAYGRWPAEFPALQAGLLSAVRRTGAVLVDAQNTYMYGHVPVPFAEDQPVQPISAKGRVRAALADELLASHARGDIRVSIGRIVSYYGPFQTEGRLGSQVFASAAAGGRAKVLGDLDKPHSASYVSDVAAGLVTLGMHERAWGKVWHLPAPPPLTTREFLDRLYAAAGHPTRYLNPPGIAIRLAGLVVPLARELAEMLYMVDEPTVVDDGRFRTEFRPLVTPHDDGIERTLNWFRDREMAAS